MKRNLCRRINMADSIFQCTLLLLWQSMTLSSLLRVLSLASSIVITRGIYNRYFHPLSKFPGPIWGSITDLYLAYMISSVPVCGLELHKKYGLRWDTGYQSFISQVY